MGAIWAAESVAASGDGSGWWRVGLILGAIVMLTLYGRWRRARQPPSPTAKELRDRDNDPNRYRDTADRALVELLEASREITAQLDTKIRFVNRLVREADARSDRLESQLAEAKAAIDGLEKRRGAAGVSVPGAGGERPETGSAAQKPSEPDKTSASKRFRSALQARIVALRDEGKDVSGIAKATGLSILEIQLALEHADSDPEQAAGRSDGGCA